MVIEHLICAITAPVVPGTIVVDRGKIYVSEHLTCVCAPTSPASTSPLLLADPEAEQTM
jgi:hypothetical protein